MRTLCIAAVLALSSARAAAAPKTDAAVDSGVAPAPLHGFAVGVEVGEPTSVTARWAAPGGLLGADLAVGSGLRGGRGLSLHADVTASPLRFRLGGSTLGALQLGIGVRHYRHSYDPASIDEIDDRHTGVRGLLGATLAFTGAKVELFAQGGPGYDLSRSESCNLFSGPDSICPHAQSSPTFLHAVLGLRYYLPL